MKARGGEGRREHSLSVTRFPVHVHEQDEHHLQADEARRAPREAHLLSPDVAPPLLLIHPLDTQKTKCLINLSFSACSLLSRQPPVSDAHRRTRRPPPRAPSARSRPSERSGERERASRRAHAVAAKCTQLVATLISHRRAEPLADELASVLGANEPCVSNLYVTHPCHSPCNTFVCCVDYSYCMTSGPRHVQRQVGPPKLYGFTVRYSWLDGISSQCSSVINPLR